MLIKCLKFGYSCLGRIEKELVPKKFRTSRTSSHVSPKQFEDDSGYEPVSFIKFVYAHLNLMRWSSRKKTTYDIGSGKGYLIRLLSLVGYKKIVGLEKTLELYNCSKSFLKVKSNSRDVSVFQIDATIYRFDPNSNFFCFNPFIGETFKSFIKNMTSNAHNSYFVYINDVERSELTDKAEMLKRNSLLRISIWYIR